MAEALFQRARTRRIEQEMLALRLLASANPGRMRLADAEIRKVELPGMPAYGLSGEIITGIQLRFNFPEYYPSVPVEAFLITPVRHPNVHPENGFICLWDRHHTGTSLIEAVLQAQRIVAWRLKNLSADHLMQPEAGELPPLDYTPLDVPAAYYMEISAGTLPGTRRKRLS